MKKLPSEMYHKINNKSQKLSNGTGHREIQVAKSISNSITRAFKCGDYDSLLGFLMRYGCRDM